MDVIAFHIEGNRAVLARAGRVASFDYSIDRVGTVWRLEPAHL